MRYTFNQKLLQSLTGIIGKSPYSISKYVSTCTHDSVNRYLKRGDIRLDTFLEICNAFQLDYRYFFDANTQLVSVEQLMVADEDWSPIVYHPEYIKNYSCDYYKVWCSDFADVISKRRLRMEDILAGGRTNLCPIQPVHVITPEEKRNPNVAQKVIYNALLLKSIPGIVGKTGSVIFLELGKSHNAFYLAVERGDIRVRTLVDICNAHRISIEHFFCFDDRQYVPLDIITPEEEWKPIVFHSERFNDFCVTESKKGIGLMELYKKLGYSPQRYQRTISDNSPISMCELIEACSKLGCSPLYFFDLAVGQTNVRTYSDMHRRIQELENQLQRTTAEKNQAESRLRHATAMLDMKNITK